MSDLTKGKKSNGVTRWLFIPVGILIFMCLGTVYSWSVFRNSIEELYNVGATESGGWLAIAPAATGIFFGAKNYSKNYGYVFTAYGVGAIVGTLLSGSLRDVLGSYSYTFYPAIILAILGMVLAIFLLNKPDENSYNSHSA